MAEEKPKRKQKAKTEEKQKTKKKTKEKAKTKEKVKTEEKQKTKRKRKTKEKTEVKEEIKVEEQAKVEEPKEKPIKCVTAPHKEIDYSKPRKKGQIWCCYCGEWRHFKRKQMNGYLTYERCTDCGISIEDFWVKSVNRLWSTGSKSNK